MVRPRNPQNIGAAARAMGNFGLADLRVVSPYEPTWREAVSAVGAHEILKKAKLYDTLKDALFDADLVFATTALKNRKTDRPIVALPSLGGYLEDCKSENTAIVFGSEKTGLNKEDIALAHCVLNIPTSAEVPSINLAQAVVAVLPRLEAGYKEVFHFSNEGVCSWYDFAAEIMAQGGRNCKVLPIESKDYPTAAERPAFSVLNKTKFKTSFGMEIPHWKKGLEECLKRF